MVRTVSSLLLAGSLGLLSGCLNGNNYPKQYANAYCSSLYACVDAEEIEFWTNYDDEDDCIADVQSEMEDSTTYDQYEEGDRTFDGDNGSACIEEADQIKDDSSCGDMNALEFVADAATDECNEVYPEAEE